MNHFPEMSSHYITLYALVNSDVLTEIDRESNGE